MRFGVCIEPSRAGIARRVGFDYVELGVSNVLKPLESDADQRALCDELESAGIAAETFCLLLPGTLRVTGSERSLSALASYMEVACDRAARLGGKVLVFGSGGVRRAPDGYSYERAWSEIREFLQAAAAPAAASGVSIAIEPLNSRECNILTSVAEAVKMAREVNRPNEIAVLSDLYHVSRDGQSFDETTQAASDGLLRHVHIALSSDRHAPRPEDAGELTRYFRALLNGGYDGRISIESSWSDFEAEAKVALDVMRGALADLV